MDSRLFINFFIVLRCRNNQNTKRTWHGCSKNIAVEIAAVELPVFEGIVCNFAFFASIISLVCQALKLLENLITSAINPATHPPRKILAFPYPRGSFAYSRRRFVWKVFPVLGRETILFGKILNIRGLEPKDKYPRELLLVSVFLKCNSLLSLISLHK